MSVLEAVVGELVSLVILVESRGVALPVDGLDLLVEKEVEAELADELGEVLIGLLAGSELLLVVLLSVGVAELHLVLVEVEGVVTRVPLLGGGDTLGVHAALAGDLSNEVAERGVAPGEITVLKRVGGGGEVLGVIELLLKGELGQVLDVILLEPEATPDLTEAAADVLAIDGIIVTLLLTRAVGTPAGLVGNGGGKSVDVDVLGEVEPHGAGLAGLEVVDKAVEELLLVHLNKSGDEVLGLQEGVIGHGDDTGATVVDVVEEDVAALVGLEDLDLILVGELLHLLLVAEKNVEVDLGADLGLVINDDTLVEVALVVTGMVEDLAGEGVVLVVGEVIGSDGDDVLGVEAVVEEDVVHVVDIRLVSVVVVASGAGKEDGPLVGECHSEEKG